MPLAAAANCRSLIGVAAESDAVRGVAGHREPEVRNLYRSAVERAARVGRLGGHADAGHGLGQGGVFEAALPDAERQLEGRQAVADQASRAQAERVISPEAFRFLKSLV